MTTTKMSRIAVLKLSPSKLAKFPASPTSSAPPDDSTADAAVKDEMASQPNGSENSTPVPNDDSQRRKSGGAARNGTKRSAPVESEGTPKPKGKPGPKKRKVDENGTAVPPAAAPKLGPKANTGAINAHLRALDRTGKPCRRWNKTGISLKTFTGAHWGLPYWASPKKNGAPGEGEAQSETTGSSEAKAELASSMVGSEADKDADMAGLPGVTASSPVATPG